MTWPNTLGKHPLTRLQRVFRAIPGTLGTRLKYTHLSRHDQTRDIKDVLELLIMAGIVVPIYHSDCSGIPLSVGEDSSAFKLLFLDVGLASRALALDWSEEFRLDETRLINEGALAEQFVGQELLTSGRSREAVHLHFWRREKAQSQAEIDYVLAIGRVIFPVEVKAGATGSLRSLHQFALAKNPPFAVRFDASLPSIFELNHSLPGLEGPQNISYTLLSLPLYLTCQASRLASRLLEIKK
jgi:predicted AAA+ superfamily ATPase